MIAYLEGLLVEKTPTRIVIDIHGVGYDVQIPVSTFENLSETGTKVKILTYQHVREDLLLLFGFSTPREKWMFEKLISVSGIGPKLALTVLSGSKVDDLAKSITNADIDMLTRLPGIGKKTAQRLSLELRDKLGYEQAADDLSATSMDGTELSKLEEGVMALVSLGLSRGDAQRNLSRVLTKEPDLPLDELIRRSLQKS